MCVCVCMCIVVCLYLWLIFPHDKDEINLWECGEQSSSILLLIATYKDTTWELGITLVKNSLNQITKRKRKKIRMRPIWFKWKTGSKGKCELIYCDCIHNASPQHLLQEPKRTGTTVLEFLEDVFMCSPPPAPGLCSLTRLNTLYIYHCREYTEIKMISVLIWIWARQENKLVP